MPQVTGYIGSFEELSWVRACVRVLETHDSLKGAPRRKGVQEVSLDKIKEEATIMCSQENSQLLSLLHRELGNIHKHCREHSQAHLENGDNVVKPSDIWGFFKNFGLEGSVLRSAQAFQLWQAGVSCGGFSVVLQGTSSRARGLQQLGRQGSVVAAWGSRPQADGQILSEDNSLENRGSCAPLQSDSLQAGMCILADK